MAPIYLKSAVQGNVAAPNQESEDDAHARRLREVESQLLCQAFGGRAVLLGSYEHLQGDRSGELAPVGEVPDRSEAA